MVVADDLGGASGVAADQVFEADGVSEGFDLLVDFEVDHSY